MRQLLMPFHYAITVVMGVFGIMMFMFEPDIHLNLKVLGVIMIISCLMHLIATLFLIEDMSTRTKGKVKTQ